MNELLSRLAKLSPQERSLLRNRLRRSAEGGGEAARPGEFPLSFAQQRLWLLAKIAPQTAEYNNSAAFRLVGDFNVDVFRDCLREIVRRHEILRTRIVYRDGAAAQEVSPNVEVEAPLVDLSALPGGRGEEEARRRVEAQAREPFDLGAVPLLRALLLDLGRRGALREREHVVAITLHHIVSDGWSTGVLIREFSELYEAFAAGRASPLPALELQYGDYAVWQRDWLQGEVLERQLAYWREALSGAPATLDLMTDYPRPATRDPRGAVYDFAVPASVTTKLRDLGRGCGATLFMTLLGAFAALLFRHSGQTDLCLGTPVANRRRVELEGLIGFFVNTLVMRADLSGDPSFVELLRRVRAQALGAQANQDLPFERLVEELQPERDMSRSPLFQAMFILQNAPSRAPGLAGLRIDAFAMESGTSKFDLTLQASESEDGLLFSLEYATALFDAATIERMARRFQLLLEGIAAAPERRLSELPLLPEDELRRLLVEWNPAAAYAESRCLHELFEAQVARSPNAIAVVFEDARLSYGGLNAQANRLAHHLRRRGVVADDVVGLCVERSLDLVIGVLGVLKAGGAYLPLDPSYPQARLAYMIEDARPKLILTQEALCERLPEGVETLRLDADRETLAGESEANPAPAATPQNLAYIIYTSGSTGKPKGVGVAHGNVTRLFAATKDAYGFDARDVWTLFHSFAFDFSVWEIWGALLHGGRLVVVPFLASRAPEAFHALLKREGVTVLNQTPSSFYQLDAADAARGAAEALSLRLVIFGGEALEPLRLVDWFARHGDAAPALVNMYGITETTVHVTLQHLDATGPKEGLGRPLGDLQTYLLDTRMNPVPIGVAGELYVGGAGLARGYVNRPELTAERFMPNPFGSAGERLYRTGDLARYRADGTIDYLGRIDHQVKIRGFRIELGEIEAALARAAGVRDAIVLAREDGSRGKRLVAYVTAGEATALDVAELRAAAQRALPDYMVPSAIVVLDQLPLTANGKIDRKALPAPNMAAASADRYVAPRNAREETLCRIWAEVLGLDRVGVEDNFFELGGHSLLAVNLVERLRSEALAVDVRAVFASPTPAGLADEIGGAAALDMAPNLIPAGATAITPQMLTLARLSQEEIDRIVATVPGGASNVQDIYPLAPLQEGILFHHLLAEEGDPYLLQTILACKTQAQLDQFLAALRAVIARHDIFRTAILWEGLPEPMQVVWREAPLALEELEFDGDEDVATAMQARLDPRHYRLDVRRAPMVQAAYARDAAKDRWIIGLAHHHLIDDNTTLRFVVSEMQAHSAGVLGKRSAPLAFRDFVALARLRTSRAEHEGYFRDLLGDIEEPTAPFGLLDVQGDGSQICEAVVAIDSPLATKLRRCARALRVSAASLFHAAFDRVVARASGRDDVVFGTVLFGRMHGGAGMDRAVGMFINTLPLRARLGEQSVEAGVRAMQAMLTDLLRHEHASLALAQRCSGVAAPTPLFSALLNYRHSPRAAAVEGAQWDAPAGVVTLSARERTNYPVTLSVDDYGEGFGLTAQTQAPLRPERLNAYMALALEQLVEALETKPHAPLRALEVMPAQERRQILVDWNASASAYPQDKRLHELFEAQAAAAPERIAVVFEAAALSYRQLNARANRLAHHLRRRGVGPDVVVGVCAERSLEMVIGLLGVLKAGGAYLPLDPSYPRERLAYMIEDARPLLVLTQQALRETLPLQAETFRLDADWARLDDESEANLASGVGAQNLAYVIYTSGSTGRPKGVGATHDGVVNRLAWMQARYGLCAEDVVLQKTPYGFDVSVWEFFWPLAVGSRLVVARPGDHREPARLAELVVRHGVTTLHFVPSMLRAFLSHGETSCLARLKRVLCSGEALPGGLRDAFFAADGVELHNLYGPTEASIDVTSYACRGEDEDGSVPIGRPIWNTQIYLLDAGLNLVPQGVAGELYIGGVGLARGYVNRPDLTAERFVANPFGEAGTRLYRTGDLACWRADGEIEFLGRVDHQVKIRGIRIELGEIEAALSLVAGVGEAIVVAREEAGSDKRLVAYVTGAEGKAPDAAALRAALQRELPDYMVPSAFVALAALPLTASGKVDRKALPSPDFAGRAAHEYVAPRNATEETLCRVWAEALGVERVGIEDNFFELGGHSLLAMTLTERLRREGLVSDVRSVFAHPTPATLADAIGDADAIEAPPNLIPANATAITPQMVTLAPLSQDEIDRIVASVPGGAANVQDIYPLAPLQEGILFHHLLAERDPYVMQTLLAFDGRERLESFVEALRETISRHDILRTAVVWEGLSMPMQVVWREAPLQVEEVSLHQGAGVASAQLRDHFDPQHFRLDVRVAPMIRLFKAFDDARDRWLLAIAHHHLIDDNTTLRLVAEEIRARHSEPASAFPAAPPYRNFVAQARLGAGAAEHEAYFRALLGDVEEPTAPFGLLDVKGDGADIGEFRIDLDTSLSKRLRARARALRVSAASIFHLAFAQVIARASGRDDLVFGTVLFGRMHGAAAADQAVGIFINTLPIRARIGLASVADSARDMHAQITTLLRQEHASLVLAQRCSGVAPPAPLFSAILNFRHNPGSPNVASDAAWRGIETIYFKERTNYPFEISVDDWGQDFALTAFTELPISPERACAFMLAAIENSRRKAGARPGNGAASARCASRDGTLAAHRRLERDDVCLSRTARHRRSLRGAGPGRPRRDRRTPRRSRPELSGAQRKSQ